MSGLKNRPCLVEEPPPEPTGDPAGTTSPVSMSGPEDQPSLVDDSPTVQKVQNLCWGGENLVEGGPATLPINLVSPRSTTFTVEEPQLRVIPNWGGAPGAATGTEPVFAPHLHIQSPTVVPESPLYILVEESPP